jgi:hypothetical protein
MRFPLCVPFCPIQSSSRSHAIFTIIIDKTLVLASSAAKSSSKKRGKHEAVSVRAKFHLVDLAGSERWADDIGQ